MSAAWETTEEDLDDVLDQHGVVLGGAQKATLLAALDQDLIGDAVVGIDDLDEQYQAANDEVWRQVLVHPLLEPWLAARNQQSLDAGLPDPTISGPAPRL